MMSRNWSLAVGGVALVAHLLGSTGCSTTGLAVGAMVPIIENSRTTALASRDIRTFYSATPGMLFLLEGLIATRPDEEELRINASMLYFSYAFTFDAPEDEDYASLLHLKGIEHGKAALLKNEKIAKIWNAPFAEFAAGLDVLGARDLPALMWTVGNWSQFISLHLDSTRVLLDIPRVTALLERCCEIDGSYFEGLPYIILGSLHAFRPPMMGGDPEASKRNFERAISVSEGKFLLANYFYARFYAYRIQDDEIFEQALREVIAQPDTILPEYRLLNAIAKQKATRLLGEKDELF
ncbi:MAG: TRAP transporter TatT component family protein [Candidatus Krumholzibacteriia bacterium]